MNRTIVKSLLLLLLGCAHLVAAEKFRTDINPALLYWQAAAEWPALSQADHDYLFTNQWVNRPFDEKFDRLAASYDLSFKIIRRAAKSKVRCEWGYDLTDGPEAWMPGLAKAKSAAQAARLRTRWHLQHGDQAAARDELLATFVLGRNLS